MQLAWGAEEIAFRDELVAFLDEHAPREMGNGSEPADDGSGAFADEHDIIPEWSRRWQATLFDHGWMIPGYPPELGGRNATPVQTLVYLEEMARRRLPRSLHFPGYAIVAPSLLEYGTDEQKQLVPAAIRGDTVWCIGMSEPNAGSDLAGLQTRAVLDGDRFVVNGQKVWTSYAQVSDKCCCYVRTDPDVPKHKGISLLMLDMDTPGIEVRPLRHITGAAHFAEVFFTDVVVPRENLVGGLNDGWRLTQGSLAHERAGLWVEGVSRLEAQVESLVDLARRCGLDHDPGVRRRIAAAYELASSLRALGYKGFASFAQGSSAPEHSYMKLATSEASKELYELGMELQGAYGVVADADRGEEAGRWLNAFLMSFAGTIAGGSAEIQRNIIAQRVLGLPRGWAMDFALNDEQVLLRDTARALLTNECPPSLVRAHIEDPSVADGLWAHLRDFAGLGNGPCTDLAIFCEELGYTAAPGVFFPTVALFIPFTFAAGTGEAAAALDGTKTGTVALAGANGEWTANTDSVKTFVPEADRVDWIAVVESGPEPRVTVFPADACAARQVQTVDFSRRLFEVRAHVGTVGSGHAISPDDLQRHLDRATVALAAEMVGTARRIFDMTLAYAKERYQFDVPIGSFQAIQHKLADMSLAVERAQSAVQYAAMACDADDPDRRRAVHTAKAAAGEAATRAAKDGVQIHGGIGFTWEHDLHLFIRRAYGSTYWMGTTSWHHDRLADLLFQT